MHTTQRTLACFRVKGLKLPCIPYREQTHGLQNVAKNPVKKKKERKHFMKEIFYLQLLVLPFDGLLM